MLKNLGVPDEMLDDPKSLTAVLDHAMNRRSEMRTLQMPDQFLEGLTVVLQHMCEL